MLPNFRTMQQYGKECKKQHYEDIEKGDEICMETPPFPQNEKKKKKTCYCLWAAWMPQYAFDFYFSSTTKSVRKSVIFSNP